MGDNGDNHRIILRRLLAPITSWYGWAGATIALGAAGGLVFFYLDTILDSVQSAYFSAESDVLTTFGLGVIPLALWLVAFGWVLRYRRRWFRRANLWVGSMALVAGLIGALDFFEAESGAFGEFTMKGEVSLGGDVGAAVAGPVAWLGVLRVVALLFVGASIAMPALALDLAVRARKLTVLTYVFAIFATTNALATAARVRRLRLPHRWRWSVPSRARVGEISHDQTPVSTASTPMRSDSVSGGPPQRADAELGEISHDQTTVPTASTPMRSDSVSGGPPQRAEPARARGVGMPHDQTPVSTASTPMRSDSVSGGPPQRAEPARARGVGMPHDQTPVSTASTPMRSDSVSGGPPQRAEPARACGVGMPHDQTPVSTASAPEPSDRIASMQPQLSASRSPTPLPEALRPPALPSPSTRDEMLEAEHGDGLEESTEPEPFKVDDDESAVPSGPAKFNKFWSSDRYERQGSDDEVPATAQLQVDAGKGDGKGPILDGAVSSWAKPPTDMLIDAHEGGITQEEMAGTGETIKRTLGEYGVEVEIGQTRPGPTVTLYGLVPGWVRRFKQVKVTDEHGNSKLDASGKPVVTRVETKTRVKVDSIISREKDLALALKTPSIRIETPVMGKSLVGIEVPNPSSTLVTLRRVMESTEFRGLRSSAKLPMALGKGSGGETSVIDLAKMPHLLVAGSTGSGKSVFINAILSCFLMEKTPAELRLLLIDPKRVELTPYNGIPHLLTPVVVETDQVVALLKGLIREMNGRYRLMEEMGVRNIEGYNNRTSLQMPYLVVAVDELADLMMSASFDVEQSLCRLAQLGRATGIHLIVATQRPSVDVVTGLIKANFPSRVSFAVSSQIDSRTILDTAGAEKLLGRGDMLYQSVDASRPERIQGVFVSDNEIDDLVKFWRTTTWAPLPKVSLHAVGDAENSEDDDDGEEGMGSRDEMLDRAIDLAQRHSKFSTSLLQRRLRIGYPRAARLMDQLEDEGVVGPSDGSKSRDVIISKM